MAEFKFQGDFETKKWFLIVKILEIVIDFKPSTLIDISASWDFSLAWAEHPNSSTQQEQAASLVS